MVEAKKNNYVIPHSISKKLTAEDQHSLIKSFKNFDKNNDMTVDKSEFKNLLKDMGRTDVTDA